jgi:N-acetylmuramic acid 6-phosphate (MurNAc-6-P) etherase
MTDKKHTQPQTEQADARHKGLDQWPGEQVLTAIVEGQERAIAATRKAIPLIAAAAEDAAIRLRNPDAPLLKDADFGVFLDSGPEPVAGSTRMNAGTAQKAALNMFSTLTMVKLSRVYDNLMVDMQLTNAKLRKRAARMICDITGCANDEAVAALAKAGDSIKLAVLVTRGVEPQAGRDLLRAHDGNLRRALMAIKP